MSLKINKDAFRVAKENLATIGQYNNITLDPGRYQAYIKKARVVDSDKGQQVVFDIQVPSGNDGAGGLVSIWNKTDEESLHYLLKVLGTLGFDADAIESGKDIEEAIAAINTDQPVIKIKAVRKGEYTNYYIDELMEGVTAADIDDKAGEGSSEGSDNPAPKGAKPGTPAAKAADKAKTSKTGSTSSKPATSAGKTKAPEPEPEAEPEAEAEAEPEPEGGEEVGIEVGLKCKGKVQGKFVPVEVTLVDEEGDVLKYKDLSKGGKVWKCKASAAADFLQLE